MGNSTAHDLANKKLIIIDIQASAKDALSLMEAKNIRHLVVMNEGKVCGIISNRDLKIKDSSSKVRDLMSSPITSVSESTPLMDVVDTILKQKISAILVTDSKNAVSGILTTDDLLHILKAYLKGEEKSLLGESLVNQAYASPLSAVLEILANTGI